MTNLNSRALSSTTDADERLTFTMGCYTFMGDLGRGAV